jgi:hypothetical protein
MARRLTRRLALGQLGGLGVLAAFGPGVARAAAESADESSICLSMVYGREAKFESDRFRDKHLPLLRQVYGDSLERVEMRHAPRPSKDLPPAPIVASVNLWIRDLKAFGAITQQSGPEIVADLAKVTSDKPWVQYDQAIAVLGDARDAIRLGTDCTTFYYPNSETARWDAKQYVEGYLPRLLEAYGKNTLRRIEVCRGSAAQGGGRPGFASAVTFYVRDVDAFMRAGMTAGMKLLPEALKATDIKPVVANLIVRAAG